MIVKELKLRNFRNYENQTIQLNEQLNVLTGQNAEGKTNVLEALCYLSNTRSHRVSNEKKLIRHDAPFASISCIYSDDLGDHKLEAIIHNKGKTLLVNKSVVKKSSEFLGLLNVVMFSPDDLSIFQDPPKERRKLLDQELTKISKKYLHCLLQYQALLKERNALLKQQRIDESLLMILDERIIDVEIFIIETRRDFEKRMNPFIQQYFKDLYGEDLEASISYVCMSQAPSNNLKNTLQKMYDDNRRKDVENHFTSIGIHREDMIFKLNQENVIYGASQGQKRMMMLAFKMALLHFIEESNKTSAVLLLDDVLSELDQSRQQKLMDLVGTKFQCIVTTTMIPPFIQCLTESKYIVENGHIRKAGGNK